VSGLIQRHEEPDLVIGRRVKLCGQVRAEKQAMGGNDTHGGHRYILCVREYGCKDGAVGCSEMLAPKLQAPENHPEESTQLFYSC
jgi:hypothetical protein